MFKAARDFVTILRARVFMHSAYALRYLGTRRWIVFSLLHYVWWGQKAGCQPNPFVRTIRDADGRPVDFADYLRRSEYWTLSPGPDFDADWYRTTHALPATTHPFLHFWRVGFDKALPPAPDFDLGFFRDVVAVFRPDKKEFAFERLTCPSAATFPRREQELRARQEVFRDSIHLVVQKQSRLPRRRLVFVQARHDFTVPWTSDHRSFDIMLNIYDDGPGRCLEEADTVVQQNGTKTTAIYTLMRRNPAVLAPYELVLFLDDDVEISQDSIEQAFDQVAASHLDLAQPCLSEDSACAFAALKQPQAGRGVRPISTVEIMMPILSQRALSACFDVFAEAISGWGVDALLAQKVRKRYGNTIALLSDIQARHTRPVDVEDGPFYKYLGGFGIEPAHELGLMKRNFGIPATPESYCIVDFDDRALLPSS